MYCVWDWLVETIKLRAITYDLPIPDDAVTLPVQGYRQTQNYTCGFVVCLIVIKYFRKRVSAERVFELVGPTFGEGATETDITRTLRLTKVPYRLRSRMSFELVQKAIDSGKPIIASTKNHWLVIYGYGLNPRRVFVAGDGLPVIAPVDELSWATFSRRWDRRGVICG